ncbi:hypothetical protein EYF80_006790 [Liparis tanakae]|uniref:Uncharacterized protein n=1 Tax=Liparis tanakae TaxID=230148 RepID=A0A4Z2J058_9TELE|nr:hypothetical protein EYF80_006790 [Liparis tanakae]
MTSDCYIKGVKLAEDLGDGMRRRHEWRNEKKERRGRAVPACLPALHHPPDRKELRQQYRQRGIIRSQCNQSRAEGINRRATQIDTPSCPEQLHPPSALMLPQDTFALTDLPLPLLLVYVGRDRHEGLHDACMLVSTPSPHPFVKSLELKGDLQEENS